MLWHAVQNQVFNLQSMQKEILLLLLCQVYHQKRPTYCASYAALRLILHIMVSESCLIGLE